MATTREVHSVQYRTKIGTSAASYDADQEFESVSNGREGGAGKVEIVEVTEPDGVEITRSSSPGYIDFVPMHNIAKIRYSKPKEQKAKKP